MNHGSIKNYHELAKSMPISFAPGVAAELRREKLKTKRAKEFRERERAYRARMQVRQDQTPGDRVVKQ